MVIKAQIALIQNADRLIWGGRGYQPEANFNRNDVIGEYLPHSATDTDIQVKTSEGKILLKMYASPLTE